MKIQLEYNLFTAKQDSSFVQRLENIRKYAIILKVQSLNKKKEEKLKFFSSPIYYSKSQFYTLAFSHLSLDIHHSTGMSLLTFFEPTNA